MKEVIKRFSAETPRFFKRVRAFALSLSALGVGMQSIPNVPAGLLQITGQFIWVGAVAALVAQMACSNPEEVKS